MISLILILGALLLLLSIIIIESYKEEQRNIKSAFNILKKNHNHTFEDLLRSEKI